jgi:hypothetical protein
MPARRSSRAGPDRDELRWTSFTTSSIALPRPPVALAAEEGEEATIEHGGVVDLVRDVERDPRAASCSWSEPAADGARQA